MATSMIIPEAQETTAVALVESSSLPSIASIRHRMTWMAQFRALLKEYVEEQMDPARHMYSFGDNRYTPIQTRDEIKAMLAQGEKPALNQDGIHNLMALYEADIHRQEREVLRDDGHYTVKVTLWLRYFGGRQVMGYGTCTTRETKYAYRWVYESDVPKDVDKAALKFRTYTGRNGKDYKRYRLDNEELGDVENTVDQIAFKRAKSSAVKSLPGVSEMFATVGDPDEEKREEDRERLEVLDGLKLKLSRLKAVPQAKAIAVIFGQPLSRNDIPKQDLETLLVAVQRFDIATAAGINWQSETLEEDLKQASAASAKRATEEIFGDGGGTDPTAPAHYRVTPQGPQRVEPHDPQTGEVLAQGSQPPAYDPDEGAAADRQLALGERAVNPGVQGGN